MREILLPLGLIICLTAASVPRADSFFSGLQLGQICDTDLSACADYVSGVYDGVTMVFALEGKPIPFCAPSGLRAEELAGIVKRYLAAHPAIRRYAASSDVVTAIEAAFPC